MVESSGWDGSRVLLLFLVFYCPNFPSFWAFIPLTLFMLWPALIYFPVWRSSLLKWIPLVQTLSLCLCIWDSIANRFCHTLANRKEYDHTEIIYFSIICCVRHPSLAFWNANLQKTRSVSPTPAHFEGIRTFICSAPRGNKGAGALLKDLSVIIDVLAGRCDTC